MRQCKSGIVEECRILSIFALNKAGLFSELKGLPPAFAKCVSACLKIAHPTVQEISLTSSECFFGGSRWWLVCPFCGKRSGVLYMPYWSSLFKCRDCHDLTYTLRQYHKNRFEALLILTAIKKRWKKIAAKRGRKHNSKARENQFRRIEHRIKRLGITDALHWVAKDEQE